MRSLRRQLWFTGVVVVVTLSLVLWLASRWMVRDGLISLVASRLEHDAEVLLAAIDWRGDDLFIDRQVLAGPYLQPGSGHYYAVQAGTQRLRSRSLWDRDLPLAELSPGESRQKVTVGGDGKALLLFQVGYRKRGRQLYMTLAEDIEPLEERLERFDLLYVVITLGAALGLLLLQQRRIRRALGPLAAVERQLDEIAEGRRERIDQPVPEEIVPLVETLNRNLQALARRLLRSRNGLGDMAHALKAPLALLRQEIESLPRGEAHDCLEAQARRLGEVIDRQLRRARIAGEGVAGEHWCPGSDLHDLAALMEQLYPAVRIELVLPPEEQRLPLDREDMLELAGNLLENACKWARGQVTLACRVNGVMRLEVEDDGPGVPVTERTALLSRGVRLDERAEGHGLGLAIVREVVDSYRGELRLEEAPTSGLRVVVELPLNPGARPPAGG